MIFNESCFPGLKLANTTVPPPMSAFDALDNHMQYNLDNVFVPSIDPTLATLANDKCIFDDDKPLTGIESDAIEWVGASDSVQDLTPPKQDKHNLVGVSTNTNELSPVPPSPRRPCQHRPLLPLCEPSQQIQFQAHSPDTKYRDAICH